MFILETYAITISSAEMLSSSKLAIAFSFDVMAITESISLCATEVSNVEGRECYSTPNNIVPFALIDEGTVSGFD